MIKVLNIAQFIPVEGLRPDNNISLKIYSDLSSRYRIHSEFVKPVGRTLKLIQLLKRSSKIRRDIFSQIDYVDKKYGIKISFYKDKFPLINRVPVKTNFLLPLEYKFYRHFLLDMVRTYQPDIIHAHSIDPDAYYAFKLSEEFSIPYILTLRGTYSSIYDSCRVKKILKNASSITTPNYTLWSLLKMQCNIELLPHGIDNIWFNENQKIFNSDSLRLVTVSRLLEMKNIPVVLKAVARLIAEGFIVTYDIVGDGEFREKLEGLTNELRIGEFVTFHGFRNAEYIRQIFNNTDIFVMLSYPETFGLSYFEAAAQGLYIIGVWNTGAYGHFTEKEATFIDIDENQLIDVLKNINNREFAKKTSRMRSKVSNFSNSRIIERYYEILIGLNPNHVKNE